MEALKVELEVEAPPGIEPGMEVLLALLGGRPNRNGPLAYP
jgi:hypothetical protein